MLVRDWMMKDPPTVGPQTPVRTARRLMQEHGIGHLPVVDKGLLVGIVTDREFRPSPRAATTSPAALAITSALLDRMPVAAVMRQDVVTTTPSTSIGCAAHLLVVERLGALPVMAGGILVGILSHTDALVASMTGM